MLDLDLLGKLVRQSPAPSCGHAPRRSLAHVSHVDLHSPSPLSFPTTSHCKFSQIMRFSALHQMTVGSSSR